MFHYQTPEELKNAAEAVGAPLPLTDDLSILQEKLTFGKHEMHNRIVIQPMEGCDGTADGAPGELTIRRYDKFARSGAGVIWAEACAVLPEGRANPRQLWLTEDNLGEYKKLTARIRELAVKEHGYAPLLILQATHPTLFQAPRQARTADRLFAAELGDGGPEPHFDRRRDRAGGGRGGPHRAPCAGSGL